MYTPLPNAAAEELREQLLKVGFAGSTIRQNEFQVDTNRIPLVAFSHRPFDTLTSCAAAIAANGDAPLRVAELRPLGAPLIYVYDAGGWDVWYQGVETPQLFWPKRRGSLARFTQEYSGRIDPRSIFRAKTVWRAEKPEQMTFVDAGFLHLVEETAGRDLCHLVEKMLSSSREALHWHNPNAINQSDAQWLVKANFWLLAAKILHDKKVPNFKRLDFDDVNDVFHRVTSHYGVPMSDATPPARRKALAGALTDLQRFAPLELVSTETLAYVYENALITKETRRALGTHSTPGWLVDYIFARLAPWIEAMPAERRFVYEPACGHAPFLLGAMRLLSGLDHCSKMDDVDRHRYLKDRLRGAEVDDFAREVARLSLTLADIPNPNGWHLDESDMFRNGQVERAVSLADIIVSNPPFEKAVTRSGVGNDSVAYVSKAAELLRRTALAAQPGSCLAFIVPRTTLDTKKLSQVRKYLSNAFDWLEVCVLPDQVFVKPDAESAVLIGRKRETAHKRSGTITYQIVADHDDELFAKTGQATYVHTVASETFARAPRFSFFVPALSDIWDSIAHCQRLGDQVSVGQGFFFRSKDHPKCPRNIQRVTAEPDQAHSPGFTSLRHSGFTHELPAIVGITNDVRCVDRTVAGWEIGKPQIVMNYAPVRRGPWQVTAFLDAKGRRASDRFLILRPLNRSLPLRVLWALLNSPVGNAYLGTHSSKREILAGTVREFPMPPLTALACSNIDSLVKRYFLAATAWSRDKKSKSFKKRPLGDSAQLDFSGSAGTIKSTPIDYANSLKFLHWRIDSAVLQLYNLDPLHERMLLDYFAASNRVGVPFTQDCYFPRGLIGAQTLTDLLSITVDWAQLAQEHEQLIEKEYRRNITMAERNRLDALQRLADLQSDFIAPPPVDYAEAEMQRLKRLGKWIEA